MIHESSATKGKYKKQNHSMRLYRYDLKSMYIIYLTLHILSIIYSTVSGQYDAPQLEMEVQNISIIT